MKILFVDHSYHKITGSSQFLVNILSDYFDVDVFFLDPEKPEEAVLLKQKTGYDVVILWQMDFLAPFFLGCGFPTIVIPMYDGSGAMPDIHWLWSRRARFINFSRRLHDRIIGLGAESLLLRYYPQPRATNIPSDWYDDVRVFLWQRRPEHGINLQAIEKLFGNALSAVHVHNATDDPAVDATVYRPSKGKKYDFTTSEWFASKSDYAELLTKFNVFVAPRRSEGIGMGFIEAMARGMIVCAHDMATHDEYIANGLTGVLFNTDALTKVNLGGPADRRRMGALAVKSVEDGHLKWLDSLPKIVDFVRSSNVALSPEPELASEDFLRGLVASYYAGIPTYKAFLERNVKFASLLAGFSLEDVLDDDFNYNPSLRRKKRASELASAVNRMPWLHHNRLEPADLAKGAFLIDGSAELRDGVAWLAGEKLVLGFRLDTRTAAIRKVSLRIKRGSHEPIRYSVVLNDVLLDASVLTSQTVVQIDIPEKAMRVDSELHLRFEDPQSISAPGGNNLGIESIVFE